LISYDELDSGVAEELGVEVVREGSWVVESVVKSGKVVVAIVSEQEGLLTKVLGVS
jgi:hypothetical protein